MGGLGETEPDQLGKRGLGRSGFETGFHLAATYQALEDADDGGGFQGYVVALVVELLDFERVRVSQLLHDAEDLTISVGKLGFRQGVASKLAASARGRQVFKCLSWRLETA